MATNPELSDVLERYSASLYGDPRGSFTVLDLIAVPRTIEAREFDTVVLAEWQAHPIEEGGFALLRIRDGNVLWAASWQVAPVAGPAPFRVVSGYLANVYDPLETDGFLVALGLEHVTRQENHLAVARVDVEGRLRWLKIYDPIEGGRRSQVLASGIAPFDDDPPSDWEVRPQSAFLVHGTEGLLFKITADGNLVGGQRMYKGAGSVIGTQLRRAGVGFFAIGRTLGPQAYGWILHVRDVEEPLWERAYASTEPDGPFWFGIALGGESLAAVGGNVSGGLQEDSLIALLEPTNGPGGVLSAGQVRTAWTLTENDDEPLRLRGVAPRRSSTYPGEPSVFALAGDARHSPWLLAFREDGVILWQKRYPTEGFANPVIWPAESEIAVGGQHTTRGGEPRGFMASTYSVPTAEGKFCAWETRAQLRRVDLRDQPLPMRSERVDMAIEEWTCRPGPDPLQAFWGCPNPTGRFALPLGLGQLVAS